MKKKIVSFFNFLKLHRIKIVLILDFLSVPFLFFCRWMASFMLSNGEPCLFALAGIQCITCGGTRCVRNLLNGDFLEAFRMNQLIFICIMLLAVVFVLINFAVLFNSDFAKKGLKRIFSIPGLITFLALSVGFLVVRNIDNAADIINDAVSLYKNINF